MLGGKSVRVWLVRAMGLSVLITLGILQYVQFAGQQRTPAAPVPRYVDSAQSVLPDTAQSTLSASNESDGSRLSRLSDACLKHGIKQQQPTNAAGVTYNMVVNDQLRILFCVIGKAASSAWRKVILVAAGVINIDSIDSLRYKSVRKHGLRSVRSLRHHKWDKISFYLNNYYKFLFTRHPFDRIVSAYRDKFRMQQDYFKKYGKKIIEMYRGINASQTNGSDVTLTEFVRYLVDTGAREQDLHWTPQHLLCRPCNVKYDFIGHYETLWQDAGRVLQRLGVAGNVSFPHWTSNKTAADSTQAMLATVPQQYLTQLRELYAKDFQLFGYD